MLLGFRLLSCISVLIVVYIGPLQAETVTSFPTCNATSQEFNGFTFTVDSDGQRVWSHCGFPNPLFDQLRCGWASVDTTVTRYVCDPDNILDEADATTIDVALKDFQNASSRQCNQENSIAGFVVVNRTRIADLSSPAVCINRCGEIRPTAATSGVPSEKDMEVILENFGYNIRRQWKLGSCQNDLVIFYWHEYGKMYISYGDNVPNMIPLETMTASLNTALHAIASNDSSANIADAMQTMLKSFIPAFSLTQPATILFILNFAVVALVTIFLILFTNMGRKEYDMWGVELHWQILGKIVYYLSGLWIIELIFKGVLWVQSQSLVVVLVFPVSLCVLCIVGFLIVMVK